MANLLSEILHPQFQGQTHQMAMSMIGFSLYSPISKWSSQHSSLIEGRVSGELSDQSLSWYGEDAKAIGLFSCSILGALLGKYQEGEINDTGFMLGEGHLAGYIAQNMEAIAKRVKEYMPKE